MKITEIRVFKGKNIYSHKKCIRLNVDLEGYCETPSNKIEDFNFNLVNMIPELRTHRCGIDEDEGFIKRLNEGTYLAHICEHIILAIQNKIGIDVHYGKSREIKEDFYYIVFQYIYENTAKEVVKLAIDIINSLIKKVPINYDERIALVTEILNDEIIGPTTKSICDYAEKSGLPVMRLGESDFYQIGYGKQGRIIEGSISSNTKCISVDISCDKMLTKEILNTQGIPVAQGGKVTNVINLLKEAERIGYPVVLKPQYGNKGKGVILNIKNEKELLLSYNKLKNNFKDLLIEKYYVGKDYRVCVINNKVIAVALRLPPFIIGNGKDNILNLIKKINNDPLRGVDHEKPLTKIKLDEEVLECITKQDKNLMYIPLEDEKIYLRKNANLSTGGIAIDYTDEICEENIELCIRVAKALNLDICGIDICTNDISKPLDSNSIIMEVNSAPGLRMHLNPSEGTSRDVGKEIVNMLYENNPHNIPVVSITGTNGKTTTTRIISHTLSKMGYCVGMTSTDGIYINEKCIHSGDDTGYESAKSILLNSDVDIAVLETARGGIIRKGLAYNEADVAVITNIREDHLGIDNINTMEELCYVKSLVGEAVKKEGYVVINADDKYSNEIIDRIKCKRIFFTLEKENKILKNTNEKDIYLYIEDDNIVVINENKKHALCNINDIPLTLNGVLKFNIENVLAASAALIGMKIDYCMIRNGLMTYKLTSNKNSGRFNCYNVQGINVILDYGHNPDGYEAVLSSVNKIKNKNGKVYGIIGVPGDREERSIMEVASISSKYLDYIIVKEDKDLRGREKGEVAKLLVDGILNKDKSKKYEVILREEEALIKVLNMAKKGDIVIVFFEEINNLINIIEEINVFKLGNSDYQALS